MTEKNATRAGFQTTLLKQIAVTNTHLFSPTSCGRSLSLRWYLVLLVAGTLLPVVLFAVLVVHRLSNQEQAATERRILLAARNLSEMIDRELSSTTRTLQALASSEPLNQGNLRAFHSEAARVAQTQTSWITVILLSPEGQQVVNTIQPFGGRLPSAVEPASLWQVIQTRQPTVGNLTPAKLKPNLLGVPVRIPILRNNRVQYVLTAVINQKAIAKVVSQQNSVDGEWTRTIVDGQGVVVARTRNPERFVGQRGTPSFLKQIRSAPQGIYRDTTLEGKRVYVAFSQIGDSSWAAAVTVPIDVVQSPTQKAMGLVVGSGLALLLLSGIGAFILSRRISRSITSAAVAAEALARGEYPQVRPLLIREVVLLGQSLELAANLLSQREQERTENLLRAEAAREEAEAANRIKDEFLAVLSHELRTPLNPILGWSNLLRHGKLDAAKTAFALETIERNAKLQTQLIEDLLDVARIMQGKLSLMMAPVNLASTLAATIETVRLAAEAKQIHIQTRLAPVAGKVLGDAARLQQILWNLLSNAVKFTAVGGWVEVRLEQVEQRGAGAQGADSVSPPALPSRYAQIQVVDSGKGISPDFLPHVFEYFRQEDGKTTRKFGGLGLGLAIVRHLVELHGGTVHAESLGEGQGATFTVQLPLLQAEGQGVDDRSADASLALHPSPLMGLQVLLVDDDGDTRDFISFLLEQNGAIITAIASASTALQILDQAKFDLLISDIGMPGMDGYELIQHIRDRPAERGGQIAAIALTAYAGEYNQQQALRAGFQRHVAKPVDPEAFINLIVDLASERNRVQQP